MSIELVIVKVADLAENDYKILGIGINKSSNSNGVFSTNYTTLTQAKDNLKNLILTKKGERLMNPKKSFFLVKVQITIRVLHRHSNETMKILPPRKSKYPIF